MSSIVVGWLSFAKEFTQKVEALARKGCARFVGSSPHAVNRLVWSAASLSKWLKWPKGIMKLLNPIFDFLLGCHHRQLSQVFTIEKRTYKVCFACGQELDYSWARMRLLPSNLQDNRLESLYVRNSQLATASPARFDGLQRRRRRVSYSAQLPKSRPAILISNQIDIKQHGRHLP